MYDSRVVQCSAGKYTVVQFIAVQCSDVQCSPVKCSVVNLNAFSRKTKSCSLLQ